MTALSIRNMNYTLARREQEGLMSPAEEEKAETFRYYCIERKAKRGKDKWILVRAFWSTPERAQYFFNSNYQVPKHQHRLREIISPAASQQ